MNEPSAKNTSSPTWNPCPFCVIVNIPVTGSYAAPVGVCCDISSAPVINTVSPAVSPCGYSVVIVMAEPLPVAS